ncbi:MAG: hypothetical protein RLZZ324_1198 [Candidatus Parcubacteria bacterium]|jgi:hypothetical protein
MRRTTKTHDDFTAEQREAKRVYDFMMDEGYGMDAAALARDNDLGETYVMTALSMQYFSLIGEGRGLTALQIATGFGLVFHMAVPSCPIFSSNVFARPDAPVHYGRD